jgi:predicted ferric reductase
MTTWLVLRAAGIGAYLVLFLSVVWGLVGTTSVLGKRVSKVTATNVHHYLGVAMLPLLGLHLGGLLIDKFRPFGVLDLLAPLHSAFRPVAVAFGIMAMYLSVVVLLTTWAKKRLGTTWWRRFHLASVPTFTLAMVHGVWTGTDSVQPWLWWTYMITGAFVLFLVLVRGLTARERPTRRAPTEQPRPAVPTTNGHIAPTPEKVGAPV